VAVITALIAMMINSFPIGAMELPAEC